MVNTVLDNTRLSYAYVAQCTLALIIQSTRLSKGLPYSGKIRDIKFRDLRTGIMHSYCDINKFAG